MMQVYQINLSDAQYDEVNANGWEGVAWGMDYFNLTFKPSDTKEPFAVVIDRAVKAGLFQLTREIDTDNLDEAFAIGNGMGDDTKQNVLTPTKSISVGDVIVFDGIGYIVDQFGFKQMSNHVTNMIVNGARK